MDLEDWSWYWTSTSPTTPTHPRASSVGVERFFTNESSGPLPVPQWATASKKKRKRKPKKTFATFIFKVLEEVHPDTEVSSVCPLVREDCSRGQHICKLDQYRCDKILNEHVRVPDSSCRTLPLGLRLPQHRGSCPGLYRVHSQL